MSSFFLGVLGVLALIAVFILGAHILGLWKIRFFHPGRAKLVKGEEVPSDVASHLAPVIRELRGCGFQEHFFLDYPDSSLCEGAGYRVVLLRGDQKTAALATYKLISGNVVLSVSFYSFLESGQMLMTSNQAVCDLGRPEHFIIQTGVFGDVGEHFDEHFTTLLSSESSPILLDEKTAFLGILQFDADEIDYLKSKNIVGHDQKGDAYTYRVKMAKLPLLAVRSFFIGLKGVDKLLCSNWCADLEKATTGSNLKSPEVEDVRWELDSEMVADFRAYESQKKQAEQGLGLGRFGKAVFFLLSLVAAIVWLKWLGAFGWVEVASIVIILFIHELGHSLTMRAFGYQNLSIFFIPFLGAAATGRKRLASAWEEYWVLMMGPLPGFVAGFVILIMGYFIPSIPAWLLNAASLSLVINGFNFLPLSFLDGGRMLDLVVFRRVPRLRFFLMIASSIGGVILAFVLAAPGMLVFSVIGLFGLGRQRKIPLLVPFAKANIDQEMSENESAIAAMRVIREAECHDILDKPLWYSQVDELVNWSVGKQMGVLGSFLALGMHGLMLALPVAGVVGLSLWFTSLFSNDLEFAQYEEAMNWRERAIPEHVVSEKGAELLQALQLEPALYAHLPEVDYEDWSEMQEGEKMEPVFVRAVSQPALTRIHGIPSWREASALQADYYGSSEVVTNASEILYLSAEDWYHHGEAFKSLTDLAILFKISESCHPNTSNEQFQEWVELQSKSIALLEKVAEEVELPHGHRDWFARKLATPFAVEPESLIAMEIEAQQQGELLSLFGGLEHDVYDEGSSDGAVIKMLYDSIRKLEKRPAIGRLVTQPEDDYETLQQLASNAWKAEPEVDMTQLSTRALVEEVVEAQKCRRLLSQRLHNSLQTAEKMRLNESPRSMAGGSNS